MRVFGGVTPEDIANEARALVKLCGGDSHPNLVEIFQHGWLPVSTFYFIDMELCEYDLDEYLRRGKWSLRSVLGNSNIADVLNEVIQFLQIAADITNGLLYIHDCDEVHRDVKPTNSKHPGTW